MSIEKKEELAWLDTMEDTMQATNVVFISKDHQQAMGMDDDEHAVESRLTKVGATPEKVA